MSDTRRDGSGPLERAADWAERYPRAVDVGLAVLALLVLAPSTVELVLDSGLAPGWEAVLLCGVGLLQLAMATRRSHPLPSYGAGCLGMLLLTVSPYIRDQGQSVPAPLLPSALLFFVLLYTVARELTARWAAAALGVALLGGVLVLLRVSFGRPWWSQVTGQGAGSAWLVLTALIVAGAVGAYSVGRLRRTRQAYLVELQHRARRTEADRVAEAAAAAGAERRRIAREMHDVVSHSLAVMISQAEGGRMLARASGEDQAAVFGTIADAGRAAMTDMRAMLGVLRGPEDAAPGTLAPQPGLAELPALVEQVRAAGTRVTLTASGVPAEVTPSAGLTVFRLVQESLTNVVKHAGSGASARVHLDWRPGQLAVEVSDDGRAAPALPGGTGLVGMTERVAALGGSLHVGGRAAGAPGWSVVATVPVSAAPVPAVPVSAEPLSAAPSAAEAGEPR